MNYGIPYMGSKSKICTKLIAIFPKAENFYDVFGGGFSVTHAMMYHRGRDYKNFYFNELRPDVCRLIQDAIAGKYSYDVFLPKWISREEFFDKKESNAYIKTIWSFGNNGRDYLFGKDIEPLKKSLHQAVVFNEFDEYAKKILGMDKFKEGYSIKDRRAFFNHRSKYLNRDRPECELQQLQQLERLEQLEQLEQLQRLQQLEQLQRLQRLQQLERLQRLQQLERLEQRPAFTNLSYEKINIKPNSIVYCDPPYLGTAEYDNKFNHKSFYNWAHEQKNPVYISEYTLPDDRFKPLWSVEKRSLLSSDKSVGNKTEKVFGNHAAIKQAMGNR